MKHKTIKVNKERRYICNQAVDITKDKIAEDDHEVDCQNCIIIMVREAKKELRQIHSRL